MPSFDFVSDNTSGVAEQILDALGRANEGQQMSYGSDAISARLQQRFRELFECDCEVFPVATGTAANALSLSLLSPPYGSICCYRYSHVGCDECGAPEFFTGGAKLALLDGIDGKIPLAGLRHHLQTQRQDVHAMPPGALSLTQQTEAGTHYSLDEVDALCALAHEHGLGVHMDGARFANALVGLGCSPARLTWQAGVDVLSFGATKNGAMCAEAVVLFKPDRAAECGFRRMRAGHLMSKMRFAAAQLEAYLADELWLVNARHANAMAQRLHQGLEPLDGMRFIYPVQGNQLFIQLDAGMLAGFRHAGFQFFEMNELGPRVVRLVTAFDTRAEDVDSFIDLAKRLASGI